MYFETTIIDKNIAQSGYFPTPKTIKIFLYSKILKGQKSRKILSIDVLSKSRNNKNMQQYTYFET